MNNSDGSQLGQAVGGTDFDTLKAVACTACRLIERKEVD